MRIVIPDPEMAGVKAALETASDATAGLAAVRTAVLEEEAELARDDRDSLLEAARRLYCQSSDNDVEVDDDARLSVADNGTWVQGWLWVPCDSDDADDEDDPTGAPTPAPD